jgi:hypothetical protein
MVALGQSNSLRILSLNCKNVGDRGAAELAKLRNLEQITLYGTQLTDAGAELLADLPNLQVARLDGRKSRKSVAPASNLEKEP